MKFKKGNLNLTSGMSIRIIASVIDVISLPFLIINPASPIAQISFGFGSFLLILGGVMD